MREEPNSPDVLTLRGLLMFLTAKTAQAAQHVQSALRLDPGHEPAMRLRRRVKDVDRLKDEGNAAFKAGKLDEAIAKYSESLEVCMVNMLVLQSATDEAISSALERARTRARADTFARCCYRTGPPLT